MNRARPTRTIVGPVRRTQTTTGDVDGIGEGGPGQGDGRILVPAGRDLEALGTGAPGTTGARARGRNAVCREGATSPPGNASSSFRVTA